MELVNIGVRLAQYASLLSLVGLAAFPLYAPDAEALLPRGRGTIALIVVGLLSSLVSIFVLAANMAGDIASATDPSTLWSVIVDTGAGRAWAVRAVALVIAIGVAQRQNSIPLLLSSGVGAASLAWGGHAAADTGVFGVAHLAADVLHILAASVWIGALVALFRLLVRGGEGGSEIARALAAFSGVGTALVAVLVGTGVVNAWRMVNWRPLPELTTSAWGWLLLAKLTLFGGMLAMAALNRFVLTPHLQAQIGSGGLRPLASLRRSLTIETTLAFGVVALVSVLGTLAPPATG